MIKKFSDFSDDFIFESLINESILYFSPVFKNKLNMLSDRSEIARALLNSEGEDISSDITFIDMSKEIGYLTFLPMSKGIEKIKKAFPDDISNNMNTEFKPKTNNHIYDIDTEYQVGIYNSNNNIIKVGKFTKKVLDSIDPNNTFSNSDIEKFVNDFKSVTESKEEFKIVSGDEIEKYYNTNSYYGSYCGTLGNSCMNDQKFFKLYTENPESCRMLILTRDDKVVARALVWKLHKISSKRGMVGKPEYLMDRVYFIKDYQKNMMEKYASGKGWAYKNDTYQYNSIIFNNEDYKVNMVVKVKPGDYRPYPYLDTFCRYDADNGLLYNDSENGKKVRGHLLRNTGGGFITSRFQPTILTRFKDWFNK